MALSFIQAAVVAPATQSATAVIGALSSATNGDLLVMSICTNPPISISAMPANWVKITQGSSGIAFAGVKSFIYYKHASAEPANYTVQLSGVDFYSLSIIAIRGQNGSSSAIDTSSTNFSTSGTAVTIPSVTPTGGTDMWLGFAFQYANSTAPTGWDLAAGWTPVTQATSTPPSFAVGYKILAASGATGTSIFSASVTAAFNPWLGISVALLASGGAATVALIRTLALTGVGR